MDDGIALTRIAEEVERDSRVVFSSGTAAALLVVDSINDPDISVDRLVRLIQGEPLLAARVVAVANSAAYSGGMHAPVFSLRAAIDRVGLMTTRSLAIAIAGHRLAEGGLTRLRHRKMIRQLWQHTAHVAALASIVARRVTGQNPDAALFAGIVHEIGSFYLLSRLKDFPALFADEKNLPFLGDHEAVIGMAICQALNIPDDIRDAVAAVWSGYLAFPPVTLGDTLLLADELAPIDSPFRAAGLTGNEASMRAAIDALIGQKHLTDILTESAQDVESLANALAM